MVNSMQILKTIPYSEFYMWDVKRFVKSNISSKYDIVELSNYISERSEKVKLFDFPNEEFGILGVNNKIGLFDAYKEFGKNINQAYKRVENQNLAYNPYRVNVGSIGWKTENQKNYYISPAYVVFKTQNGLSSEFLYRMFKTDTFNQIIRDNTTGSVRQNLKYDTLSKIKIPLPPLKVQNRIVANYNTKIQLAQEQEQKAKQLEQEVEDYLFEVLGIEKLGEKESVKGLQFVHYKNIDRWDVWNNIGNIQSNKYENTSLKNVVIGKPMYGANVKGVKRKSETRYIRITDINENGELNNEFVSPASVDEKFLLKNNDFLIARSGNTVGKTLLFKEKYGRAIYAGYLVRYSIDFPKILPEYLLLFSKSYIFKKWIESNQRVSGQPNINGQEFLQSPLVLPPLETQTQIANHILSLKKQIKDLQNQAKENREKAIQEFEDEIFSKS